MRIITMQRLTMDGEPVYEEEGDIRDWFCVIETPEEELVYDEFLEHPDQYEFLWNAMVKHAGLDEGLAWGDDDVWGYFRPNEVIPKVGEEWTDGDNDRWGRVR